MPDNNDNPRSNLSSGTYVKSPCIRDCCLDENDICHGCHRTLDEILIWSSSTSVQKREIIVLAQTRARTPLSD